VTSGDRVRVTLQEGELDCTVLPPEGGSHERRDK
jgi:hypothetical protein